MMSLSLNLLLSVALLHCSLCDHRQVCEEWIFRSPIDRAKWSFFLTYVVPLPMWKSGDAFARLQGLAAVANEHAKEHVERLLKDMESDEHGAALLTSTPHINGDKGIASLCSWVDSKMVVSSPKLHAPPTTQINQSFPRM